MGYVSALLGCDEVGLDKLVILVVAVWFWCFVGGGFVCLV